MKRYNFGQNEFGDTGITGWVDVENGHIIDNSVAVPKDSPRWLRECIEAGFEDFVVLHDMIEAQDRDAEATRDDAKYHENI